MRTVFLAMHRAVKAMWIDLFKCFSTCICAVADDKLQRVKVMFLLTLLLQIKCFSFILRNIPS